MMGKGGLFWRAFMFWHQRLNPGPPQSDSFLLSVAWRGLPVTSHGHFLRPLCLLGIWNLSDGVSLKQRPRT